MLVTNRLWIVYFQLSVSAVLRIYATIAIILVVYISEYTLHCYQEQHTIISKKCFSLNFAILIYLSTWIQLWTRVFLVNIISILEIISNWFCINLHILESVCTIWRVVQEIHSSPTIWLLFTFSHLAIFTKHIVFPGHILWKRKYSCLQHILIK